MTFSPVTLAWLMFAAWAALIVVAGNFLSRYGDVIADKTGLGGTWVGLVMLATVTSLPELVTGVSSVTLAAAPNIALGDVLGSSVSTCCCSPCSTSCNARNRCSAAPAAAISSQPASASS